MNRLCDTELRIIDTDTARQVVDSYRQQARTIVFTNGCFDVLHIGHLRSLEESARQGDVLIVGLNSDVSVRRLKGGGRPVMTQRERAEIIAALRPVDHVIIFDEDTPLELIRAIRPDVLVKGADYSATQIAGAYDVMASGGRVHLVPLVQGVSTTQLIREIRLRTEMEEQRSPFAGRIGNVP